VQTRTVNQKKLLCEQSLDRFFDIAICEIDYANDAFLVNDHIVREGVAPKLLHELAAIERDWVSHLKIFCDSDPFLCLRIAVDRNEYDAFVCVLFVNLVKLRN